MLRLIITKCHGIDMASTISYYCDELVDLKQKRHVGLRDIFFNKKLWFGGFFVCKFSVCERVYWYNSMVWAVDYWYQWIAYVDLLSCEDNNGGYVIEKLWYGSKCATFYSLKLDEEKLGESYIGCILDKIFVQMIYSWYVR